MIDEIDRALQGWVASVLEATTVSLAATGDGQPGRGICLYLMSIAPYPPPRGPRRPPLQVALRYLVSSWSESIEEAHRMLGELLFAAMENPEFDVELGRVPTLFWRAFNAEPRPCFVLRIPFRRERAEPEAPQVRQPLVVRSSHLP